MRGKNNRNNRTILGNLGWLLWYRLCLCLIFGPINNSSLTFYFKNFVCFWLKKKTTKSWSHGEKFTTTLTAWKRQQKVDSSDKWEQKKLRMKVFGKSSVYIKCVKKWQKSGSWASTFLSNSAFKILCDLGFSAVISVFSIIYHTSPCWMPCCLKHGHSIPASSWKLPSFTFWFYV